MSMEDWLDRATEKIRFYPDRAAVRRELEDHFQDRQEHYAARGLAPEEAEAAAVGDMGNAADVAEELGKLHRPFWGYLWELSQWVVGLTLFALVLILFPTFGNLSALFRDDSHLWERSSKTSSVSLQTLPGHVRVGSYTVSASSALAEQDRGQLLYLSLRFLPHIFWERIDSAPLSDARFERGLTDDSGRLYCIRNGWMEGGGTTRDVIFDYLEFCIRLEDGKLPEWVDIPLGISDYTLRVDLEKGVSLQ